MSKRKVQSIFDNGTGLVQRTQYMIQEDGTIGDAISCFQTNHAPLLWKTPNIELVGILSEKDLHLPYGQATPSLTLPCFKLQDVMESNDFLVFQSARSGERKNAKENHDDANEQKPPAVVIKKEKATPSKSTRQPSRMSLEARRLEDYLAPPVTQRQRTRQQPVLAITGACLDDLTETRPEKRAKLKHDGKNKDDSSASIRHHRPKHKHANKKEPAKKKVLERRDEQGEGKYGKPTPCEGPFPDCVKPGSLIVQETRRVYASCDNETPFDIETKFGVDADRIVYDNRPLYPSLRQKSRLKPLTAIVLPLEDNAQTATAKHKHANQKEPAKKKVLERRDEQGEGKYGKPTPCEGPFPDCVKPGSLIVQETRRVYISCDNETPFDIETKFGVDADRIVYDNRRLYPSLRRKSRLKPLTAIVLPLEDNARMATVKHKHADQKERGNEKVLERRDEQGEQKYGEPTPCEGPSLRQKSRLKPLTAIVLPLEDDARTAAADMTKGEDLDEDEWLQETIGGADNGPFTIYSKKSTESY